jgi:hypothetical protein
LSVAFSRIKTYTVEFYVDGVLEQTVTDVTYGSTVEYDGIPTRENASAAEDWKFIGWNPEPVNVTEDMVCVAQFKNMASQARALITGTISGTYVNNRVGYVGTSAFNGCKSIVCISLPLVSSIDASAFNGCSALTTLVLSNTDSVCTLANTNALSGTKIASGTGYIYVPSALMDSYKTATNWSTYAARFRAIEDYPDITGGVV